VYIELKMGHGTHSGANPYQGPIYRPTPIHAPWFNGSSVCILFLRGRQLTEPPYIIMPGFGNKAASLGTSIQSIDPHIISPTHVAAIIRQRNQNILCACSMHATSLQNCYIMFLGSRSPLLCGGLVSLLLHCTRNVDVGACRPTYVK
jgi:hypothetical protein